MKVNVLDLFFLMEQGGHLTTYSPKGTLIEKNLIILSLQIVLSEMVGNRTVYWCDSVPYEQTDLKQKD